VAAAAQRAAGITFCLCVAAGWADLAAYNRRYARWSWQRKVPTEESLVSAGACNWKQRCGLC
jgi:hypothetical protein